MLKDSKIFVAGHRGLVGASLVRKLKDQGHVNILTRTRQELDLTDQHAVHDFFQEESPEYVFLAAAKVGGIMANNTYPAEFIHQNLAIQTNVIHESYLAGVKRLIFLGSSCIYPRDCPQPIKEEYLLTGPLEPTNRPYALAKIAGIEMCWSYNRQHGTKFLAVMPTNLYGPGDNFDLETSHVIPAMLRKFHLGKCLQENNWEAVVADLNKRPVDGIDGTADKSTILTALSRHGITVDQASNVQITLWGTGTPRREFLHVDDLAGACAFLMQGKDIRLSELFSETTPPLINIGCGQDIRIKELAETVKDVIGFNGKILWDHNKPDGTPRKLTDATKLHSLGWRHKTEMNEGLRNLYRWYLR